MRSHLQLPLLCRVLGEVAQVLHASSAHGNCMWGCWVAGLLVENDPLALMQLCNQLLRVDDCGGQGCV